MFTAALFTTAKTWKQPKCPLTEEQVKRRWYMYTVDYDSARKRNQTVPHAEMGCTQSVIQTEVRQKEINTA